MIGAKNDWQAIQYWLSEYKDSPETYRTYRKEAERLFLWCLYQHKKPFSSLLRDDFDLYEDFLKNPRPEHIWQGSKLADRGDNAWRPFEGKLSSESIVQAFRIINSLFDYLVEARYLDFNPLVLKKRRWKWEHNEADIFLNQLEHFIEKEELKSYFNYA